VAFHGSDQNALVPESREDASFLFDITTATGQGVSHTSGSLGYVHAENCILIPIPFRRSPGSQLPTELDGSK
jgi:hypothetical protein